MYQFDNPNSEDGNDDEVEYFDEHPNLAIIVRTFLVIHTFISATRGLFYGVSFIVFEEKMFGSFFRKWFGAKNESVRNSSPTIPVLKDGNYELNGNKKYNYTNDEENNDEDYNDDDEEYKKDGISGRASENVEMNTSEVRFIEDKNEK